MKYLFTFLVSILILIAVLIPGSNLPAMGGFMGLDKFVHISMFGGWAVAVCYDFKLKGSTYLIAFIAGMIFSLLTEVLQFFVEGRTFDWYDTIADAVGLLLGFLLAKQVIFVMKKIGLPL
jgi:VanZ family protein